MKNTFSILYVTGLFSILILVSILSLVFYHLPDIIHTISDKKEKTEQISPPYKKQPTETPIVVEETKKEEKVEPVSEKVVKPVAQPQIQEKKDSDKPINLPVDTVSTVSKDTTTVVEQIIDTTRIP